MKHLFVLGIAGILLASCHQGAAKQDVKAGGLADATSSVAKPASPDAAILSFEKESYDFGKIKQGEKVHYDFKFKNTGKSPLIISNATATCGCTIPEPPTEPIKPGEESLIKVVFNSAGKMGMQDKVITITSNGNPNTNQVHLTGEVTQP